MRRGFRVATALAVLFTWMFAAAGPAHAAKKRGCAGASAVPTVQTLAQANATVLCLVNAERKRRGLRALRSSAPLTQAAVGHSADMVARRFFDHVGLDGLTPRQRVARAGYRAGWVEETLACGWAQLSTPRSLVTSMLRSPAHRTILLNRRLREVGVGLVVGGPQPVPRRRDADARLRAPLTRQERPSPPASATTCAPRARSSPHGDVGADRPRCGRRASSPAPPPALDPRVTTSRARPPTSRRTS